MARFSRGDVIVYAKQKWSASPGPRAQSVAASSAGELYSYVVRKFWVVVGYQQDGLLRVRTRRGKERLISEHDALVSRPSLIERVLMRHRFPRLTGEA